MDLYPWIVFVHVAGAFTFAIAHGVSAFAAFKIRVERDVSRIRALLELSGMAIGTMYVGLLVVLIAGIAGGIMRGWFAMGWIWASLAVLVAVAVVMYALATRYYAQVRAAVGMRAYNAAKDAPPPTPLAADDLARLLDTRRPDVIAATGIAGLAVILWLMILKPF